jgi:hypothetical protein
MIHPLNHIATRSRVQNAFGNVPGRWLGVATLYDKRAVNYRAMVVIASLMMWLPS